MAVLRRSLRPYSWLALFAFLCGWMLPFYEAHSLGLDDAACVTLVAPDHPAQLQPSPRDEGQPAHCVVCHLMRAMSGAVSSDVTTLAAPFVAASAGGATNDLTLAATLSAPSSRGPPAVL